MKTLQETKQEVLDTTRGMTKDDMVEWAGNLIYMYEKRVAKLKNNATK